MHEFSSSIKKFNKAVIKVRTIEYILSLTAMVYLESEYTTPSDGNDLRTVPQILIIFFRKDDRPWRFKHALNHVIAVQ